MAVQGTVPCTRRGDTFAMKTLRSIGTRVPVDSLVDYLKGGHSIEEFLRDYPTVERWQLESYLDLSPQGLDYLRARDESAP